MAAQGQQGDDKNALQVLWIIFGIFMIAAFIWWQFGDQLKQLFIFVKKWELKALALFSETFRLNQIYDEVASALKLAERLTPYNIGTIPAQELTEVTGKYLRFPLSVFVLVACYFFYSKNVKVRYKKRYSMKTLLQQEKVMWPQVEVVSKVDLIAQDLDKGPWAMAKTPMQFCKMHKLLHVKPEGFGNEIRFIAKVDKQKAEKCFSAQLGRPWRGPDHMAPHRKALLAIFIGRGCRDTKASTAIVERLNRSIGSGRPADYKGVDDLLRKHFNTRDVQEISGSHAYETTLITSMLLFARQDGVLATSDFLWLKPLDRRFWYTLNNVGRQTPVVEVAGVHAHWLAEKSLGISLSVPCVKEAVKGLEIAISEMIYIPTPEEKDELLQKARESNR